MPVQIAKPYLDPQFDNLIAEVSLPRRALFLDRDGVININHGYVHTPEATEWVPGIFELCAKARLDGYLLIVVTNQAGIARGYYSTAEFLTYTRWVHEEFASRGCPLAATYYCPHYVDGVVDGLAVPCDCRKPEPGMLLEAARTMTIDLSHSLLLGDSPTDILAGQAAGLARSELVGEEMLGFSRVSPVERTGSALQPVPLGEQHISIANVSFKSH